MGLWSNVEKLSPSKRPKFNEVWTGYPAIGNDPCDRDRVRWQCAVYLSAALASSGIIGSKGFDGSHGYGPNPTCRGVNDFVGLKLARGSQSLADFLHHRLFPPERHLDGTIAKKILQNQRGIIFYKHISGFTNQGGNTGSHIDLWNGPNIVQRRDQFKMGEYFTSAKEVQFWKLVN